MAEDFENTIIIGSDDDTDTDDVVIIKEEIEVDCEDVIFLSETRPEQRPLQEDCTVKMNESVITFTKHQTLEDKCQVLFTEGNGVTDTKLNSDSVGPLDLSAKPDDLSARPDDLSTKQDPNSCMIEQILCKSSKLSTDSNLSLSEVANSNKSSFMLLLNAVEDKWQASQNVPKLDTVCSDKNTLINMLGMDSSVMDLNSSLCSGSVGMVLNQNNDVATPGSGNSNVTYDWSPVAMSLLGGPVISGTDSSHSTNLSLDSFKSQNVSLVLTPVSNIFTTSDGMYGSGMTYQQQMSSSDLTDNNCSSHLTNTCFTDTLSVSGNSNTDTSLSISNRLSLDDPFYNSHQLLSTLDQMFPTGNSTPCITSLSTSQAGVSQSSPQYRSASCMSLPQPSGLVGSGTNCQRSKQRPAFNYGCTNDSNPLSTYIIKQSQSSTDNTCLYNPLTLPLSMQSHQFKRSMSTSIFSTSCSQSVSQISFQSTSPGSTEKDAGPCSSQGLSQGSYHLPPKKQKRCYSDTGQDCMCTNCFVTLVGEKYSRCPNGHVSCSKCLQDRVKLVLTGKAKESVKCLNNSCDSFYPISKDMSLCHICSILRSCTLIVNRLSGELRQSLPSMVVEILEDKLDQDYVNFISDMILKNASMEMDTANDMDQNDNSQIDAKNIRQYEDCPGHWNLMDERIVTKNGYVEVKLEPGSAEYDDVVAKFFESMVDHNVEVTSVHRIQNPILWKYYTVKKSEMIQDNEGFGSVVEGQLFHGTTSHAVEAICRKGFDWRLCGKHGTMYGQGSYFAVNASYSHQYTDLRRPQGAVHTSMYQPQGSAHTTIMYQPTSVQSSPSHQSLLFTADKFNFGQHLNPNSASSTCPLTGMPISFYRPMNLSNTAAINGNQLSSSLTSLSQQQQQPSYVWPGSLNSNAVSSSSDVNGSSLVLNSTTSTVQSPTQSSILTSGGNSPSTSTGITPLISLQMRRMEKLRSIAKLIPKPLAIRHISGLASVAITTSMDMHKPEVKKVTAKVFYARVLVGKSTHGHQKLRKPPPLFLNGDNFGKYYDSCVDNITNPKIFVIFDSSQAYPEYLLEYAYCVD